jgi:hypothetical protein
MARSKNPRRRTPSQRRGRRDEIKAWGKIAAVVALLLTIGVALFVVTTSRRNLDEATLCPAELEAVTVLLVDVTDPLTLPQRQDLRNQLERLKNEIPRYGKLAVVQVDATSARLLNPIITRCNPGTAEDVSSWTGNPAAVQQLHETRFERPLDEAFDRLSNATGADRSPILESVQSVTLTELQGTNLGGTPRRLIIVSDLLQHTDNFNFYGALPSAEGIVDSAAFRSVRTDLRDVSVELWMLQRPDTAQSQPRKLVTLWEQLVRAQGGTVTRAYNVSG